MSGIKSMNRINRFLSIFVVFFVAAAVGVYLTVKSPEAHEMHFERTNSPASRYEKRPRPAKESVNRESESTQNKKWKIEN